MTSKNDKSVKLPTKKGNVDMLNQFLARRQQDPNAEPTADEDTLLLQAYLCYHDPIILSKTVAVAAAPTEEEPKQQNESTNEVVANVSNSLAIVNDESLLLEASERLVGCNILTKVWDVMKSRIEFVVPKLEQRLSFYMNTDLPDSSEFQTHWTFAAYKSNVGRCCEILGIAQQLNKRIETVSFQGCMLCPQSTNSLFPKILGDNDLEAMRGLALYYNLDQASFCQAMGVGTGKTFISQYKLDRNASKTSATRFAAAFFPESIPSNPEKGGWNGLFGDLTLHLGIGIDTTTNDCLTRTDGSGIFVWDERTLKKLEDMNMSGASLKDKQTLFIVHMMKLTYELMMDERYSMRGIAFQLFIGKAIGLRKDK